MLTNRPLHDVTDLVRHLRPDKLKGGLAILCVDADRAIEARLALERGYHPREVMVGVASKRRLGIVVESADLRAVVVTDRDQPLQRCVIDAVPQILPDRLPPPCCQAHEKAPAQKPKQVLRD